MAEIIKAHEGALALPAITFEKERLGPGHVGAEPAEKNDARCRPGETMVGDCCTIVTC